MHILEQHHPGFRLIGRVAEGLAQLADLLDLDRSPVRTDDQEIRVIAGTELAARRAGPAGLAAVTAAAVDGGGHSSGEELFADAIRPPEEKGVGHPFAGQGPADQFFGLLLPQKP